MMFVLLVTALATAAKIAFVLSLHAQGVGLWDRPF
jgi:hypothetical protein